jgi:hypothetical protein
LLTYIYIYILFHDWEYSQPCFVEFEGRDDFISKYLSISVTMNSFLLIKYQFIFVIFVSIGKQQNLVPHERHM